MGFPPIVAPYTGRPPLITGCRHIRTDAAINAPLGERGDKWSWPQPLPGIDLADLDLGGPNRAVKFFTEPAAQASAILENAQSGDRLRFDFAGDPVKLFGVWINRGGRNNFEHIAIELSTGAPDPLDIAVQEWKQFAAAGPRQAVEWEFQITVG